MEGPGSAGEFQIKRVDLLGLSVGVTRGIARTKMSNQIIRLNRCNRARAVTAVLLKSSLPLPSASK